ncbi:hypothetical protein BH10PSE13_BH10PSE13_01810 [soil metagenome]
MAEWTASLAGLALALIGFGGAPVHAERLPPKDECARDAPLAAFNGRLRIIVARKDGRGLLTLVAPDASNGFGDIDAGPKGVAEEWALNRPATSAVWAELRDAMALGCARDGASATMPYLSRRIGEQHDPFETYVAKGTSVAVRAAPDEDSARVATLDWDVVTARREQGQPDEWVHIAAPSGYVRRIDLRSPIDYRLVLERRRGQWTIAAFVVGD